MRVHVLIKGRVGQGWYDVERTVKVPAGTTVGGLIERGAVLGVPLAEILAQRPRLADALLLNGERCPLDVARQRELADGDRLYLLAPLAGG